MIRPAVLALLLVPTTRPELRMPVTEAYDYTAIPASARELEARVRSCTLGFAEAIAAATQVSGGVVGSVRIRGSGASPVYEVTLFGDGTSHRVVLDGKTGEIASVTEVQRFPGDPITGELVASPTGLSWFDLRKGEGEKPSGPTARVRVHYSGWLLDGTLFDSSHKRGEPIDFRLDGVIPGWTEGVGGMQVGGKRKLVIPAKLAYGQRGRPGIPGNATLVFDVELLEILP